MFDAQGGFGKETLAKVSQGYLHPVCYFYYALMCGMEKKQAFSYDSYYVIHKHVEQISLTYCISSWWVLDYMRALI